MVRSQARKQSCDLRAIPVRHGADRKSKVLRARLRFQATSVFCTFATFDLTSYTRGLS